LADARSNTLIVRAANPARLASVRALIQRLDQPGVGGPAGMIHVVYLKNADAAKLDKYSAKRHADQVGMPILIVHGELDYTVPVEQSRDMVAALKRAKKPYEYVEIKDMDHYLRPDQGDDWKVVLTKGKDFFDRNIGPGWTP